MRFSDPLQGKQQITPASGDITAALVIDRGDLDKHCFIAKCGQIDLFERPPDGGGHQSLLDREPLAAAVAGNAR